MFGTEEHKGPGRAERKPRIDFPNGMRMKRVLDFVGFSSKRRYRGPMRGMLIVTDGFYW